MGVVFEAEDERLGRRVALKVLRHDGADPQARERLIREARVAASVVHPLICQVYALGTLGSSPFIAMELVEGESLAERLARGPVPADRGPAPGGHRARGPGRAAPARRGASRPQALEHVPRPSRPEAARLRPGAAVHAATGRHRRAAHGRRHVRGHAAVRLARTAPGAAGGRALRSVLGRGDRLRDAGGPAALQRRHAGRAGARRALRGHAGAHRIGRGDRRRSRAAPRAGQGARRPLRHGRGVCRRSRPPRWRSWTAARSWTRVPSCAWRCCRSGCSSPTRRPTTWGRAWPTRWPARSPASSRWSCAPRSSRPATHSRRSTWSASPPTWPWTSCSQDRCSCRRARCGSPPNSCRCRRATCGGRTSPTRPTTACWSCTTTSPAGCSRRCR